MTKDETNSISDLMDLLTQYQYILTLFPYEVIIYWDSYEGTRTQKIIYRYEIKIWFKHF